MFAFIALFCYIILWLRFAKCNTHNITMAHRSCAAAVLLLLAVVAAASAHTLPIQRTPSIPEGSDMCDTCLWLVNTTEIYLNSSDIKLDIINFLNTQVGLFKPGSCTSTGLCNLHQVCTVLPGDMALQCQTLATLLVPKIIEYLITNFDPTVTCKDVGICTSSNTVLNDFTCPVCQLVLNTTLHQALDPDTQVRYPCIMVVSSAVNYFHPQKQLHDAAHSACKLLQDDKVADCQARADEALNQLAAILRDINPTHTCALLGLCGKSKTLQDVLRRARAKTQYVVMAAAGQAHLRSDFCEACQIAVLEAAAFLADPQTQVRGGVCFLTVSFFYCALHHRCS